MWLLLNHVTPVNHVLILQVPALSNELGMEK